RSVRRRASRYERGSRHQTEQKSRRDRPQGVDSGPSSPSPRAGGGGCQSRGSRRDRSGCGERYRPGDLEKEIAVLHSMVYVFLISAIILTFEVHAAGVVPIGNCPAGVDFEKSGYIIRSARVETPFQYLSWLRTAIKNLGSNSADLAGRPYENSEVRRRADELEKTELSSGSDRTTGSRFAGGHVG